MLWGYVDSDFEPNQDWVKVKDAVPTAISAHGDMRNYKFNDDIETNIDDRAGEGSEFDFA